MTAYVVVHAKTKDQEELGVYAKAAGQTLTAHGANFGSRSDPGDPDRCRKL